MTWAAATAAWSSAPSKSSGPSEASGLKSIGDAKIEKDPKKGDFYIAVIEKKGRSAVKVIAEIVTDVVKGLDCGANDYIAKPFKLAVLLARLRAQLRIFENSEDAVFTIGPYTFRPAAKLLQEPAKNRRIRLTEKEAAILKFLYRAGTRSVASSAAPAGSAE